MYPGFWLWEAQSVVFYEVMSSWGAESELDLMNVSRNLALGGLVYRILRVWKALGGSFFRVLRVWRGSVGLQIPPT